MSPESASPTAGTVPSLLWSPTEAQREETNLVAFVRWLEARVGFEFRDYEALWQWSVTDVEAFWRAIWDYYAVNESPAPTTVTNGQALPDTRWFPGVQLNFAAHVFRGRDPGAEAIRYAAEDVPDGVWDWATLREQTQAAAAGLRRLGVVAGDRVAACLPNAPETIAAFLATASIGAIWTSAAPEFGAEGIASRFQQIEPKVLLAVDAYQYGGRVFDRTAVLASLRADLPTVEQVVVMSRLGARQAAAVVPDAIAWEDFAASTTEELTFREVDFDHPLYILYSSGTTGPPKPIVHGHGGILVEHLKALHLHFDARPADRVFWFTTTGWMMWNFLTSFLLTPASIVLYDGSPAYPDLNALWDLAARCGITIFGTSAGLLTSCMKEGIVPRDGRDLSELRAVGSTGSPLSVDGFRWVYDQLGPDLWLFSTSGGTDICTAIVGGVATLPVYEGELQARMLGVCAEAWDAHGHAVVDEVGELVITKPLPSMPVAFWNDPSNERYHESYFDMFPGVWRHGDWIVITDRGSAVLSGRSDATINRGGVRMGTGEIYRAVLAFPEITDALVVDIPRDDGIAWMPLFVVLRDGVVLDGDLIARIKRRIREEISPRHVPDAVISAPSVPRTLTGKLLEVPVKRLLMGADPARAATRDALADPSALDWFIELGSGQQMTGAS